MLRKLFFDIDLSINKNLLYNGADGGLIQPPLEEIQVGLASKIQLVQYILTFLQTGFSGRTEWFVIKRY